METMKRLFWVYRAIVLGVIILGWELIVRLEVVDAFFLASPIQILSCMDSVMGKPGFPQAFLVTLIEIVTAFALAASFGLVIGMIIGLWDHFYHSTYGIILLLYGIPKLTIIPLFVLYFGIGINCRIAFGAASGFFPILLNTIAGARSVEPSVLIMSHSMGATPFQMFTKIIFPSILPSAFTGLRLGMNHTLLGVVLAELFFSQRGGMGYYINLLTSSFKTDELFAIVVVVAAIAILANQVLLKLERHFSLWQEV